MEPEDKTTVLAKVETSVCGLVLNNLEDMKTVAQLILQSGLAPSSFKTSEQIFVGLQTGAEIGLKPLQSLNSIVVINGKPTLWGDAALALVKKSGLCEYCEEYFELDGEKILAKDIQYTDIDEYPDNLIAVCETKRKDAPESVIRYFSVADAKLARLWKKAGPWTTHPKRMMPYKARAFNLRDNFPDVLFGMHLTEEMYGEEPLPAPESDVPPRDERRNISLPSSTVDTTRAPVTEPIPGSPGEIYGAKKQLLEDSRDKLTPESIENIKNAADGEVVSVDNIDEIKPGAVPAATPEQRVEAVAEVLEGVTDAVLGKKPKPESKLVTFQCPKCLRTYQYGKEEGRGVKCECGKGVIVEQGKQEPAGEEEKKTEDVKALYTEVNGMFVEQGGQDFIIFASYVLCLDENEVGMNKLTAEQLRQIKAYIETSGIEIA